MDNLINAIKQSCAQQKLVRRLYMSLTMPDICSKLENPNSKTLEKDTAIGSTNIFKPTYKSNFMARIFIFCILAIVGHYVVHCFTKEMTI